MPEQRTVVITQPMYFPWVGLFEQIRLADEIVWLDDVQFARGFINRVQCKTRQGISWLTIPLVQHHRDTSIRDLAAKDEEGWRERHQGMLRSSLAGTPFLDDALSLAKEALEVDGSRVVDILETGLMAACRYFGLQEGKTFRKSSEMRPRGTKSDLILDLVETCRGTTYVTGLGARNYLDHEGFEARGIEVRYMDYKKTPYPQPHGEFTPFVSVLDLVANVGRRGVEWIHSGTVHWSSMQDTAEHHPTTRSDA